MTRYDMSDVFGNNMFVETEGDYVKYEDVKELIDTLKEYLNLPSMDGKSSRQPLRIKLKELIK